MVESTGGFGSIYVGPFVIPAPVHGSRWPSRFYSEPIVACQRVSAVPTLRGRQSDPAGGFLSSTFQLLCRVGIFSALALGWVRWFLAASVRLQLAARSGYIQRRMSGCYGRRRWPAWVSLLMGFSIDGAARRPDGWWTSVVSGVRCSPPTPTFSSPSLPFLRCRLGFVAKQFDGQ